MRKNMFQATINDVKSFRDSIEAIAVLIDEGTFQIDKNGISLRAMDPSQIALVDLLMPPSAFEEFKADEPTTLGIDFTELSKICKRAHPEDKIDLSLNSRLKIIFKGKTTREYNISIIDSTSNPPKEPNIEFTAQVKIGAPIIKETLKDAELVSNHVAIKVDKDGLTVSSDGDTGSVNIQIPDENILSKEVTEDSRSVFSLNHLDNLLKAADATSLVSMSLKTDSPMKLEYAIGEGRVIYFLAPRIESV
ncbi:MAG: proliferating cell nuclear antigen (pcna) [Candidatus Altiarchaeota archaeon]